jgi:hypothetical protein
VNAFLQRGEASVNARLFLETNSRDTIAAWTFQTPVGAFAPRVSTRFDGRETARSTPRFFESDLTENMTHRDLGRASAKYPLLLPVGGVSWPTNQTKET